MKRYTVVGVYVMDGDMLIERFADHVIATSPQAAETQSLVTRGGKDCGATVAGVFEGWLTAVDV
jgi:hypothetical protein